MKSFFVRIYSFFNTIESKIVFYPAVLAFCGLFGSFLMIYLENKGISEFLIQHLPLLMVNDGRTALTLLAACIGGLISMMVFSFSMVMVLLNQAANNYSPRLLPGLISDKTHQVILGIYLSAILFCIFTLFSIQPTGEQYRLPGFTILLGILFTVVCLCAFIYFIHNISQRIQINNILEYIFFTAKERIERVVETEEESEKDFPNTENWFVYSSKRSNYLQNISTKNLLDICKKKEIKIRIIPVKGYFVLKGLPLFKTNKKLDDETIENIISNFNFSKEELVADNYILAFKQLTEIIVKAMSPAVNDPGTAINGIDYLTELFALRMRRGDKEIISADEKAYIQLASISFEDLLYNVMASIRTYCIKDIVVVQKLGLMFLFLKKQKAIKPEFQKTLNTEIEIFLDAAREAIENNADRETLAKIGQKLNAQM